MQATVPLTTRCGNIDADHAGHLGGPGPCGADYFVGLDAPVLGDHGLDGAVLDLKALDSVAGAEGDTVFPGGVGDGLGGATGLGLAVVGGEDAAEEGAA